MTCSTLTHYGAIHYVVQHDMLRYVRHVLRTVCYVVVCYAALCHVRAMLFYVMLHIPYVRTYDRRDWGC